MTTTEGNKIIAEFMGYEKVHEDLYYHSNWNLLMPVVEKIETLDYEFLVNSQQIGFGEYMFAGEFNWLVEINREEITLIQSIYDAVIQFIQWYNQNKK